MWPRGSSATSTRQQQQRQRIAHQHTRTSSDDDIHWATTAEHRSERHTYTASGNSGQLLYLKTHHSNCRNYRTLSRSRSQSRSQSQHTVLVCWPYLLHRVQSVTCSLFRCEVGRENRRWVNKTKSDLQIPRKNSCHELSSKKLRGLVRPSVFFLGADGTENDRRHPESVVCHDIGRRGVVYNVQNSNSVCVKWRHRERGPKYKLRDYTSQTTHYKDRKLSVLIPATARVTQIVDICCRTGACVVLVV